MIDHLFYRGTHYVMLEASGGTCKVVPPITEI